MICKHCRHQIKKDYHPDFVFEWLLANPAPNQCDAHCACADPDTTTPDNLHEPLDPLIQLVMETRDALP